MSDDSQQYYVNHVYDEVSNTTAGQLQDVTMDNSYATGYRSPAICIQYGDSNSPGQVRSMREIEEQMAALKKENFNLKLRIYFLEEKIPGFNTNNQEGVNNLMKQNIDLKVDLEALRKELKEKQSLLCEAAKAMEIMEEQHKKAEERKNQLIEQLNQKMGIQDNDVSDVESLKQRQSKVDEKLEKNLDEDIDLIKKITELENKIKETENINEEFKRQTFILSQEIEEKNKTIEDCQLKIKQLLFQTAELNEQLELKKEEVLKAERKLNTSNKSHECQTDPNLDDLYLQNKHLMEIIRKLEYKLESQKIISEEKFQKTTEQQNVIEQMQNHKLKEDLDKYKITLADKLCIIDETEKKLKDKTIAHEKGLVAIKNLLENNTNLQNKIKHLEKSILLTNESGLKEDLLTHELAKSKVINNMESSLSNETKTEILIHEKDVQINNLTIELDNKKTQLQELVNKEIIAKHSLIHLLEKILHNINNSIGISPRNPLREINDLQNSLSDNNYKNSLDRNNILQKRIENLIENIKTTWEEDCAIIICKLKNDISNAKDELDTANKYRKELMEIFTILTLRLEELAGFLNTLLNHKDVLAILGTEKRHSMKKAIDRSLILSKSLNNTSLSVSAVSLENSLINLSNISAILDNDYENKENTFSTIIEQRAIKSLILSEKDNKILLSKTENERRKTIDTIKKDRKNIFTNLNYQSESEAWSAPDRDVSLARIGIEEKFKEALDNTSTESDTFNRKTKSKSLEKVNQLRLQIAEKDNIILKIQCDLVETDNRLKKENLKMIEVLNEKEIIINELKYSDKQLNEIKEKYEKLQNDYFKTKESYNLLKTNYEQLKEKFKNDLDQAIENEKDKSNEIIENMTIDFDKKLKEQEKKHNDCLERDWISSKIYEQTTNELLIYQKKLKDAKFSIDFMQENNKELNEKIKQNEMEIRNLQLKLDETTMQASKTILECTKNVSDKLALESRITELMNQIEILKLAKYDIEKRYISATKNINIENESKTIIKDHILEHNIINSDGSNSGYTSEDIPMISIGGNLRRQQNTSPDLGIESDVPKNMHQIKLSQNDTNVKQFAEEEGNNDSTKEMQTFVDNEIKTDILENKSTKIKYNHLPHECAKVDLENSELRRKLTRTKRALEDTWKRIHNSNLKKEQIERDIRLQIQKTQNVLKNVGNNMKQEIQHNDKDIKK